MTVNSLALVGDSLTEGFIGLFGYRAGGKGNWAELVRDRLASIPGLGPLVSSGARPCNMWAQVADWTFTSGGNAWSTTATTDAWDKSVFGSTANGVLPLLYYAVGAAKIATYTAGADINYPNVGFQIKWVDYASGTTATPSYSTDGGSTWIDFPDTPLRNNSVRVFYVATPLTLGSTVKIRGANSAGTNAGVAPMDIEIFYQTPTTASGLIVHNLGVTSSMLHSLAATTSGDHMAWFDSVVVGTGAISTAPNRGIILEAINDVGYIANKTTWAADLAILNTRLSPLCPIGIISPWEVTSAYPIGGGNGQSDYRAQTKTTAASFSPAWKVLDIYDQWAAMGITGNAQTFAAGFLIGDFLHESQAGHIDLADRIYWWLRNQFLSTRIAGNSNPFTLGSSALGSATQLGGRPSAIVTGTATMPLGGVLAAAGTPSVRATAASLVIGGTLAASGVPTVRATGTLAIGGVLASSGTRKVLGAASLACGGTLAATGKRSVLSTAALTIGGVLTAVGEDVQTGTASLDLGGVLDAEGVPTVIGAALLRVTSDQDEDPILWPEGDTLDWPEGDPILWAEGVHFAHADGTVIVPGAGLLDIGLVLAAESENMQTGAATLNVGGVLAASGTRTVVGAATCALGGTLAAAGTRAVHASAALAIGPTLTALGEDVQTGTGQLAVGGVLAAVGHPIVHGVASMPLGGTFTANGTRTTTGTALLTIGGVFTASAGGIHSGVATLVVGGVLAATGHPIVHGTASLACGPTFTASGTRTAHGTATLNIGGVFAAVGQDIEPGTATTSIGGTFTAHGVRQVHGAASLALGGTLSAHGVRRWTGTATSSIGGTFTAAGTRKVLGSSSIAVGPALTAAGHYVKVGTATLALGVTLSAAASGLKTGTATMACGIVLRLRTIPPMVTFSARAAADGWQFTASSSGWHARPAHDGWKVEAR